MFEPVMTALLIAQQDGEAGQLAKESLAVLAEAAVAREDGEAAMLLLELIGFAEHVGVDSSPLEVAFSAAMAKQQAATLALESQSEKARRNRLRSFAGETKPKMSHWDDRPPHGAIRVSSLPPPNKPRRM